MIRLWRSLLIISCFVLFGIGAFVIGFFIFPYISITKSRLEKKVAYANIIHKVWSWFKDILQKIKLIKINIENEDRLKNLSSKIIVASHPSFIDIVVLIGLIPKSTCFAKKETLKNPFFRNIVKSIYIINDMDLDKLKIETDKFLKEGFNIIIFPSGTRIKSGEDFKIHKGPAAIALNSDAEIIPVKITADYPFLQKGQPIYDVGEKVINYNIEVKTPIRPLEYSDMTEIKARKAISEKIKEEII